MATFLQRREALELWAARLEVLRKIQAWITAWSERARTVVTRCDQMIKLGIAKRRARKAEANGPESRAA